MLNNVWRILQSVQNHADWLKDIVNRYRITLIGWRILLINTESPWLADREYHALVTRKIWHANLSHQAEIHLYKCVKRRSEQITVTRGLCVYTGVKLIHIVQEIKLKLFLLLCFVFTELITVVVVARRILSTGSELNVQVSPQNLISPIN